MSPYSQVLKPINDVSPYFQKNKEGSMIFIGDTLELRIPTKFSQYGALTIGEDVSTLGVFDMIINNEYHVGFNLLGNIVISPSDIGQFTYAQIEYTTLFLNKNDVFMKSTRILQYPNVVYIIWTEWVTGGKVPYYVDYKSLLKIFEHVRELTGQGIGVSRSVFEGIIAHLSRDKDNLALQYRLTDMEKPMKFVALNSVSQAPSGNLARLNGAYFRDQGLTSALLYDTHEIQPFENIIRGLPANLATRKDDPVV